MDVLALFSEMYDQMRFRSSSASIETRSATIDAQPIPLLAFDGPAL